MQGKTVKGLILKYPEQIKTMARNEVCCSSEKFIEEM